MEIGGSQVEVLIFKGSKLHYVVVYIVNKNHFLEDWLTVLKIQTTYNVLKQILC